jgi:organic hydroperoxide reductase OsmC/OhrA
MSEHHASVEWQRTGEFRYESYSRAHVLKFGDLSVAATAAADNIPASAPAAAGVDPEQAFVASLSSCHMLWFLHLACRANLTVERYLDDAVGTLEKSWISKVILRPAVSFSGMAPSPAEHQALHEKAHAKCFIANSVKSDVRVEPRIA